MSTKMEKVPLDGQFEAAPWTDVGETDRGLDQWVQCSYMLHVMLHAVQK